METGEKVRGREGGAKKTTRIALRNMTNKLGRFQGFLRPLALTLVRTDYQPGSKFEKKKSYLGIVVQGLPSFPPILSPSYP